MINLIINLVRQIFTYVMVLLYELPIFIMKVFINLQYLVVIRQLLEFLIIVLVVLVIKSIAITNQINYYFIIMVMV